MIEREEYVTFLAENNVVHEIERAIADHFRCVIDDDPRDVTFDLDGLKFLQISTVDDYLQHLNLYRDFVVAFAIRHIDRFYGVSSISRGISTVHLSRVLAAREGDEMVDRFLTAIHFYEEERLGEVPDIMRAYEQTLEAVGDPRNTFIPTRR